MKTIMQFGAGNIGRSMVGYIFHELGYKILFVEKDHGLINEIRKRKSYTIEIREMPLKRYEIDNIDCISVDDKDSVVETIAKADIISTAVGAKNLPLLFPVIKEGLSKREKQVNIIICENVKSSSSIFEEGLKSCGFTDFNRVGLIDTSIEKIVPNVLGEIKEKDPLLTWAESYNIVRLNKEKIKDYFPLSPYLVPVFHFNSYYNRKIYIANLSHTLSSVIGFLNGYFYIADALKNKEIYTFIKNAATESITAVEKKYPFLFEEEKKEDYLDNFLQRLKNPLLMDTVFRGGRDISRKLRREERLVGPALLYMDRFQKLPVYLIKGIAASFYFEAKDENGNVYEKDRELQLKIESNGIEKVLEYITGIKTKDKLGKEIIKEYKKGKKNFLKENLLK